MKKILSIGMLAFTLNVSNAQIIGPAVDTNTVTQINEVFNFLGSAGTNLAVSVYGLYDLTTKSAGFGLAGDYSVSPYIGAALRLDYLKGSIYMPQGTVSLRLPLQMGKMVVVPFTFAGVGTALGGKGGENGGVVYVGSLGASFHVSKNFSILAGYERWTGGGFNDNVVAIGGRWKF